MTLAPAKPLADVLEDEWDRQLFRGPNALATMLGWTSYHTLRSRGSKAGYPDRTCVRDRILFAELKREKTQPTRDQVRWLDRLAQAGGEVYLWRPSDLDEAAVILGRRWRLTHTPAGDPVLRSTSRDETLAAASAWLPGVGRRDSTS